MGLQISEAVSLKMKDVNLEKLNILIENAKGKKYRITIFPEKIKTELQNLITGKNPNNYLLKANEAEN